MNSILFLLLGALVSIQQRAAVGGALNRPVSVVGARLALEKDSDGLDYYARVSIGTPRQELKFRVAIDQTDSWVMVSSDGEDNECQQQQQQFASQGYNASKSLTHKPVLAGGGQQQQFIVREKSLNFMGHLVSDDLELAGVVVKAFEFGLVNRCSNSKHINGTLNYDGVLGMGPDSTRETDDVGLRRHVIRLASSQDQLAASLVSIHLNNREQLVVGASLPTVGELVLGATDENLYSGNLNYVPFERESNTIRLEDIWIGDSHRILPNLKSVAISSETDKLLMIPISYIHGFVSLLKITYNDAYEYVFAECNDSLLESLPNIAFRIGDAQVIFTPEDYVIKTERKGKTVCLPDFDNHSKPIWTFGGGKFMRKYYSVIDYQNRRFGFATSTNVVE